MTPEKIISLFFVLNLHGKYIYPMFVLSITTKHKKMENLISYTDTFKNWNNVSIHFELVFNTLHSEYRIYRYENGEMESSIIEGKSEAYSRGVMQGFQNGIHENMESI